ncbi:hypothetical protein [Streptomyces sp. TLI_171]|uniref:hypothetical protein n=1 Tax=Streptomyces sp. TLI_171 TaxID=1938859 RepID=UPI000C1A409B|nr:hypothetical protein [Streptomyces sp. TLI_171]
MVERTWRSVPARTPEGRAPVVLLLARSASSPAWFYHQFRELYGWDVEGVHYAARAEAAVPSPGATA